MFEKVATLITLILIGIQLGAASDDVTIRGLPNSRQRSLGGRGGKKGRPKSGKKKKKDSKSNDGTSSCPKEKLFLSTLWINVTNSLGSGMPIFTETDAIQLAIRNAYKVLVAENCQTVGKVELMGYQLPNGTDVMKPYKAASRFLDDVTDNSDDDDDDSDDDLVLNDVDFSIIGQVVFNCPSCPNDFEILRPDASRRWKSRELQIQNDACTCKNGSRDNVEPTRKQFLMAFNNQIEQENITTLRDAYGVRWLTEEPIANSAVMGNSSTERGVFSKIDQELDELQDLVDQVKGVELENDHHKCTKHHEQCWRDGECCGGKCTHMPWYNPIQACE